MPAQQKQKQRQRQRQRQRQKQKQKQKQSHSPTHSLNTLPLPLLHLEERIWRLNQIPIRIKSNLPSDTRQRNFSQTLNDLRAIERISIMNRLQHSERSIIRKGRIQLDILIESRLIPLAEVLRRRQLIQRGSRLKILGALTRSTRNLQKRITLQRARTKQLCLNPQRSHLLHQHRTLLVQPTKENHIDILALQRSENRAKINGLVVSEFA